jgi:hypothetical protein
VFRSTTEKAYSKNQQRQYHYTTAAETYNRDKNNTEKPYTDKKAQEEDVNSS